MQGMWIINIYNGLAGKVHLNIMCLLRLVSGDLVILII